MKKLTKLFCLVAMLLTGAVALCSFTSAPTSDDNDYTCKVTVYDSNGEPYAYVEVKTDVSGGLSCMGGRTFSADKKGVVTLRWSKGCELKKVYVKGTGYNVDYRDGGSYSLRVK